MGTHSRSLMLIGALVLLAACEDEKIPTPMPFVPPTTPPSDAELLAARDYPIHVPASYDGGAEVPLLIALHGYGGSGDEFVDYYSLDRLADLRGLILVAPMGIKDAVGAPAWHTIKSSWPDWDRSWLSAVIHDVKAKYRIDASRVWVMGGSQGAHMAHRMGCDASDDVTAIVSVAGQVTKNPEGCQPTKFVSVIQIHGTADENIGYYGDLLNSPPNPSIPSAHDTVATWARNNGCTGMLREVPPSPVDMSLLVSGPETTLEEYAGCPTGIDVALWSIQDGPHRPGPTASFSPRIYTWLTGHPRAP